MSERGVHELLRQARLALVPHERPLRDGGFVKGERNTVGTEVWPEDTDRRVQHQVRGGEDPAIHRQHVDPVDGLARAAVGVAQQANREVGAGRHTERDADVALFQQLARRGCSGVQVVGRFHIAVGPVHRCEQRVQPTCVVEDCLGRGWRHRPPGLRLVTGEAATTVGAEDREESVACRGERSLHLVRGHQPVVVYRIQVLRDHLRDVAAQDRPDDRGAAVIACDTLEPRRRLIPRRRLDRTHETWHDHRCEQRDSTH